MNENVSQNSIIETPNNDNSTGPSDSEDENFEDTVPVSETEEEQEMATTTSNSDFKLQPFYESELEMWFDKAETYMECRGITTAEGKFKILHAYGCETIAKFTYRVKKDKTPVPEGSSAYEIVKQQVISAYSQSEESRLQELFKSENLAGIKPQQMAIKLREKAGTDFSKPALKSLFMSSLPTEVRQILCISEVEDLDKLATMADRIISTTKGPTHAVNKIERGDGLNMAQLQEQLEKLT